MNFKALFATAAIAATSFVALAPEAKAGCYPALAAQNIAQMIRGGASPKQAIQFAIDRGNVDSDSCMTATIGYMRGYSAVYGDVLR